MENIFSLNYPEYATINRISKLLKGTGYSAFIPVSRQQKGVDLILLSNKQSNPTVRLQVKSSKVYTENKPKDFEGKKYDQCLWFKNFIHSKKYEKGSSDYYLFFGVYPAKPATNKSRKLSDWKEILLCFDEEFLSLHIDPKIGFFYFDFNLDDKGNVSSVLAKRGFREVTVVTDHLVGKNLKKLLSIA